MPHDRDGQEREYPHRAQGQEQTSGDDAGDQGQDFDGNGQPHGTSLATASGCHGQEYGTDQEQWRERSHEKREERRASRGVLLGGLGISGKRQQQVRPTRGVPD